MIQSHVLESGGPVVDVLAQLTPYIQDEIGGIPQSLLAQHVAAVCQHFTRETLVWKETLVYNIEDGEDTFIISPSDPDKSEIHAISCIEHVVGRTAAVLDTDGITILEDEVLESDSVTVRKLIAGASYVTSRKQDWTVEMKVPFGMDYYKGLQAQVSLRPKFGTTYLPERVLSDWYDRIASGVKARLMVMPKKSWSDPPTGALYQNVYMTAVRQARIEQNRNGVINDKLSMRIPNGYRF